MKPGISFATMNNKRNIWEPLCGNGPVSDTSSDTLFFFPLWNNLQDMNGTPTFLSLYLRRCRYFSP